MGWLHDQDERSWYDIAQICINGHVINSMAKEHPERNSKYCSKCGHPTISTCPNCNQAIQGYYHIPHVAGHGYTRPAFCINCGTEFPWTDTALKAAKELSDELSELSPDELKKLKESFEDLVKDSPKTAVAATRFKSIISKVGKSTAEGFRTILIDVLSETAKKMIWP